MVRYTSSYKPAGGRKWRRRMSKPSAAMTAKKALALARKLERTRETKRKVTTIAANAITDSLTPTVYSFSTIQEGGGSEERAGEQIFVKEINIRGEVDDTAGATATVHMAIVQDMRQKVGLAPAYGEVFVGSSKAPHPTYGGAQRFRVLWDTVFDVGQYPNARKHFNKTFKVNKKVLYNGGLSSDIIANGIYLLAASDLSPVSDPPTLTAALSTMFTDA